MVVRSDLLVFWLHHLHIETVGVTVTREDDDMTVPATAPEPGSDTAPTLGALSKLIQDANDGGLSYQEMADRAVDPGTGTRYYKQSLQKLVKNPPVNPPTVPQMQALANALGKPIRIIQAAAAKQWLMFEATELSGYDEDTRIIVAHLAGQSPADKRRWRRMIEADDQARHEVDE
jgi:hypothetical protein